MPLYSTEAQTDAMGKEKNVAESISVMEGELQPMAKEVTSWSYLFVHHRKVELVSEILQKRHYTVFIHKSKVYRRENKHIKTTEKPTISGLIFVQGDGNEIQACLKETFSDIYLVKDYSRGQIAAIPDHIMQPFMQISMASPTRIRFMPHSIDYYSKGNPLVRITSGVLAGLEGYRIRISRDKCLVTTLEGITVAIGGIHRENFENVSEYARIRKEQSRQTHKRQNDIFTPLQREIDLCFFVPQDELDIMAMTESMTLWVNRIYSAIKEKNISEAIEMALFILEETGCYFRTVYDRADTGKNDSIMSFARKADKALQSMINDAETSADQREMMETERESLAFRYPFLPIEL